MSDAQNSPQKCEQVNHTPWEWLCKFGGRPKCHYCETPLTLKTTTKDHLTPQSRGGSNLIDNVVPCCADCNRIKGNRTEEEYWAHIYTETAQGKSTSNHKIAWEDKMDERGLLKRVVAEREQVSWSWRNPA